MFADGVAFCAQTEHDCDLESRRTSEISCSQSQHDQVHAPQPSEYNYEVANMDVFNKSIFLNCSDNTGCIVVPHLHVPHTGSEKDVACLRDSFTSPLNEEEVETVEQTDKLKKHFTFNHETTIATDPHYTTDSLANTATERTGTPHKPKTFRIRFAAEQIEELERQFYYDQNPGIKMQNHIAAQIGLQQIQVHRWFQARRWKHRNLNNLVVHREKKTVSKDEKGPELWERRRPQKKRPQKSAPKRPAKDKVKFVLKSGPPETEDDEPVCRGPPKCYYSQRKMFTIEQRVILEQEFMKDQYPAFDDKLQLAKKLGSCERKVNTWFINRRQKFRRAVLEGRPMSVFSAESTDNDTTNASSRDESAVSKQPPDTASLSDVISVTAPHHTSSILSNADTSLISYHASSPYDSLLEWYFLKDQW